MDKKCHGDYHARNTRALYKMIRFSNRSKFAHNRLPESIAHDEGDISIICMFVGANGKCCFLWLFDR